MDYFRRFTFLLCAPGFDADDLEGMRLQQIIAAVEDDGFQFVKARRIEDAELAVQTDAAIGCMVVDWSKRGLEGKTSSLINLMRRRGLEMPIVILVRRKRLEDIPVEVLDYIDGYIFLAEETPEFIARNLISRLKQYAETLKTPFFGALVAYFVLNGTSSSNKVVLGALVAEGDLVLFDRNNHKAAHHGALLISGGVPIYLETDRNCYGLIGPIYSEALDEAAIREKIRRNPHVTDPEAWRKPRPFRVAVIEQCTYDGTILSAEAVLARIGHLCDYVLFDEAWAGFMKFHPLYVGRFAMGLQNLGEDSPGIIATQSTHKQLASFSQASQIHVRDRHIKGQRRRVEHRRFNESFLQHASTSPFYPLFASLDVGAQMMKGRSGVILWDDTVRLGIEIRKKLRAIRREYEQKETDPARRWFFEPFVPDLVSVAGDGGDEPAREVPWESLTTDELASDPRHWALAPGARWHGFGHVAEGFAMTDPNKLIVLTPGFDRATGAYAEHGIPAPVVAQYLRENRVVPEKNDLNSLLFLLTPGVESSKAGTLLSALAAFKRLHDDNALLDDVMPEFVRARPARYRGLRLRELCGAMHAFYREAEVSRLQREQFAPDHLPETVLPPNEAARRLVRNAVDYLPISDIAGRVATTLFLVYPPGIPTVVPGERLGERARPMLDYLRMFEASANQFPGFEAEIQGLYREVESDGTIRFHTYVVQE